MPPRDRKLLASAWLTVAIILHLGLGCPGTADAAPVTFGFSGRVTSANFGPDDQPYPNPITIFSGFSGRYTFDSSSADLDPASSVGRYAMAGSPFGLTVDIGGNSFTTANRLLIEVDNASSDAYLLGAGDLALFRLLVGVFLLDPTGGALSRDTLPLTPPPLAGFATRTLDFQNDVLDRGLVHITGCIDTLTCLAGCTGAGGGSPLPEPSTLLLVSIPLGFIGIKHLFATRLSPRSLG